MVRTRSNQEGSRFKRYIKGAHDKFNKTLTHRLVTETANSEGQVTARTTADTTFSGDIQYGSQLDKRLIQAGWIEMGDAILYVAADETVTSSIVPDVSIIINGSTSGTYDSWTVVETPHKDEVKGVTISYVYKLKKRTQETIS